MKNVSAHTTDEGSPSKTLSHADRAAVLSVAATIRAAVLSAARDDADRIAMRVVAHMTEAMGMASVKSPDSGECGTASPVPTPPLGAPAIVVRTAPSQQVLAEPAPLLLSVPEAARMLGVSRAALDKRIQRGQIPGVVRTGRRVQIHRERLLAGLERKAR